MESVTKKVISEEELKKILDSVYNYKRKLMSYLELTDGCFNNSYHLIFEDGEQVVLKVAPPKDVEVLTYEKNMMETEVQVMRMVEENTCVPVPHIIAFDCSKTIIDSPFFLMEYLEGEPFNKLYDKFSDEILLGIHKKVASYAKEIHQVKAPFFGLLNQTSCQFQTWYPCFVKLMKDLFDDLSRKDYVVPFSEDEIMNILFENQEAFMEVKEPVLLHKDIWDGNVFVREDGTISGLIDFERAIYAEPLLDLVCSMKEETVHYIRAIGLSEDFTENEKIRIAFYRFYLFFMMSIEIPYRKYSDQGFIDWIEKVMREHYQALKKL